MTNWTDIHKGFGETNQQEWEKANITKEEAKEWIEIGFTPYNWDLDKVKQWKKFNFTFEQCQNWINIGIKPTDCNFCAWLRDDKYLTPKQVLNHYQAEELREEYQEITSEKPKKQLQENNRELYYHLNKENKKLTKGSFKSYLRQNARKNWFANSKLKFIIEKSNEFKTLITLPNQSQWLSDNLNENQINKWSQQVYQEINNHWCSQCQRVGYYDGGSYSKYCVNHICKEESCLSKWEVNEQGENLCTNHFKQKQEEKKEQFNAQIVQRPKK